MKVLVIGSVYPRFHEDAEVPWLRTSIAHLKKAGLDIQVLAPAYKGLKSHVIDGIQVNRFRYAPANLEMLTHEEGAPSKMASRPWLQLLAIPYIISGFFKCLGICRKWRPDVIHAHWPFPHAYIALGATKLFGIPLALNFHGAELLLIRKKKWVRPLLKFAIGQAQAVFANSSFTAGKIKAIRNVDVEWSPYGTTLGKRSETMKGEGLPLAGTTLPSTPSPRGLSSRPSAGTPKSPKTEKNVYSGWGLTGFREVSAHIVHRPADSDHELPSAESCRRAGHIPPSSWHIRPGLRCRRPRNP